MKRLCRKICPTGIKFFFSSFFFFLLVQSAKTQTVTWDGEGGDGLWNTALNWSNNAVPTVSNDVILDNSTVSGTYTVNITTTFNSIKSLTISPTSPNTITLTASPAVLGSSFTISEGLTIQAGGTFDISNNANNMTCNVGRDLLVSGILTESASSTGSNITLNGSVNQNITATGTISNTVDIILNNAAGATLLSNVTLPYEFTLQLGKLTLGNFNLTIPPPVTPSGDDDNYYVTSGTGYLIITNPGAGTVQFPVGADNNKWNLVRITNGGSASYSVRVAVGISPSVGNPAMCVNRTWYVKPSVTVTGVDIDLSYFFGTFPNHTNVAYTASPSPFMNIEAGIYIATWNVHQSGLNSGPNPAVAGSEHAVNISTPFNLAGNTEFRLVLGNLGAVLSSDFFIHCRAQKNNDHGQIKWRVEETNNIRDFELQRSLNNGSFTTIGHTGIDPNQYDYQFTDPALANGINQYRVKVNRISGGIKYSNIVTLLHNTKGLFITSLAPNPVHHNAVMTLSTAAKGNLYITIYDAVGRIVKQISQPVIAGNTEIRMDISSLKAGHYHLQAQLNNDRAVSSFLKQ